MRRRSLALWCCALLLAVSSSEDEESRSSFATGDGQGDNSTVRYEPHANSMKNYSSKNYSHKKGDKTELTRYNLREKFGKNNDEIQYEFRNVTSENDREDDDAVRYKSRPYPMKNHQEDDQTLMELRINSMEAEGKSNFTLHEFRGNFNENNDENNIVPYEACNSTACIQLCCRLIQERCIVEKNIQSFSNINGSRFKLNSMPQLITDLCEESEHFLVGTDHSENTLFINGSLRQSSHDEFTPSMSDCLAIVYHDNLTTCKSKTEQDMSEYSIVISAGLLVSLPFLLMTFIVYSILPELKNMHGYTLRSHVSSLFVAYMILPFFHHIPVDEVNYSVCVALAFILYFFLAASFFWLNVICFDIWYTFGGFHLLQGNVKQPEKRKFIMYSIYAWGSAGVLTIIYAIMDFVPNIPDNLIRPKFCINKCGFGTDESKTMYFYIPVGITIVCNMVFFISTALKIVCIKKHTDHHLKDSESNRHADNKQRFVMYLKLFIVMGVSWIMEIVSWLFKSAPAYIWYPTDMINTLQGLIIFIIFVWRKKIKHLLLNRFDCRNLFCRNTTSNDFHSTLTRTSTITVSLQEVSLNMQTNSQAKSPSEGNTTV